MNRYKPQAKRIVTKERQTVRPVPVLQRLFVSVLGMFRWLLPLSVMVFGVLLGIWYLPDISRSALPVTKLELAGDLQRVTPVAVQEAALPLLQDGLLMSDTAAVSAKVSELAWVGAVSTQRIWPDTIRVTVTEQTPVAYWDQRSSQRAENQQGLLLANGQIVDVPTVTSVSDSVTSLPESLPEVRGAGVDGDVVVLELAAYKDLLAGFGYQLQTLAVASYGGRSLLLKNAEQQPLLVKLPRQETLVVLRRFLRHADSIFIDAVGRQPASVDLRYRSGFAVLWQAQAQSHNNRINDAAVRYRSNEAADNQQGDS